MKTRISARHFDLTPELKDLAEENFASLERYYNNIISVHLILDVEKHRKMAETQIKVYGQTISSTEESGDMYASIEAVFDKAREQLKKYKGKLRDKDPKRIASIASKATKPETDPDAVDF
ncbi:MAG: ribosome-associated translation inhibitor RaiA [candidate division Zixibacteria bacterium]|nr:ribosome-associated translation inhibitor RaiA [candidate division Zixibacteria bacterium]